MGTYNQIRLLILAFTASTHLGLSQGGLVAYYPFSGNANDMSGNGNNGFPTGGVSTTADRFGNPNSAYAFNGTGYITVNNSPSLQSGSAWSIVFWFKVGGYGPDSNWVGMVTKAAPSVYYDAGPRQMLSYQNRSSSINFCSMGPPPYAYETPIPLEWNRWYYCALTIAGDSVRSYLNAVRKFAFPKDYSWTFSNSYPLTIGSQNGPFHNRFFNGSLDEVRIYGRALNQREIDSLYNIVSPPNTSGGLVAYYPFNSTTNDVSGNSNNGSPFGGVSYAVDRFGNPNSACAFNGSGYITVNNSASLQTGSTWSMVFWFKVNGYGPDNWMGMVTKAAPTIYYDAGPRQMLGYQSTSSPICYRSMGPPPYTNETPIPLEWNRWYFCALTSAGDSVRSYLDGVHKFIFPRDNSWTFSNSYPLTIGSQNASFYNRFFNGSLDEVRIYNRALSQREIDSLYNTFPVTSDSVAIWHLDEASGQTVFDSSPYHNSGTAYGTTIVPGRFGNARSFTGSGNYISVPNPLNGVFNFASTQSFTIDAWFKTTQADTGEILRRGLAPVPGYLLRVFNGRVQGVVGDREDMPPPSQLLRITSTSLFNDGNWHHATLVRDRAQGKLYLYVDEMQAAPPLNDNFTLPITNDRPLMIGRWENYTYPTYFRGTIDEVKIFRGARHPGSFFAPDIRVLPLAVEFGSVVVGTPAQQTLEILNAGTRDTLRVTSIASNNPVYSASANTLVIPPGTNRTVQVRYLPTAARIDTASLSIASNDPDQPVVRVSLHGRGVQLGAAPIISSIRDIPNDQGKQVRVTWYRSIYDGLNDSLHIATYSLWRRVDGGLAQLSPPYPPEGTTIIHNGETHLFSNNELWDFIVTVPAVRFEVYAYVSSTLFDSTVQGGIHWTTFKVSAHTTTSVIFFSVPDSGYSVDNLPPHPPLNFSAGRITQGVQLNWEAPSDPDIRNYVLHRSTQASFVPSPQTLIGAPSATNHIDNQVAGLPAVYYRVATVDSAGNQSEYSEEIGLVLTGSGGSNTTPTQFALYQNYPNPFNPETIIEYDVPTQSHVVVSIYDVRGQELDRLVDEQRPAGSFRVSWKPNGLATGIYFCRMTANTYSFIRKIAYIK